MVKMERFDGYLFSKLHLIGSRSEGPIYFLQQFNYKEILVRKRVNPWEEDPSIHKFLGKKVTIEGKMSSSGIVYEKIMEHTHGTERAEEKQPEIELKVGTNVLTVNKMPPDSQPSQCMDLVLLVKWPFRSIWEGRCPTTQIYEFRIEHEDKTVWCWSKGRVFAEVTTPVYIPGGDFHEFPEVWKINTDNIEPEGTYTARAIFITSGQEASKDFKIKFAQ